MITGTVCGPVGLDLGPAPLDALSDADIARVALLLARHGVVVAREQRLDDEGFADFLRRFGPLAFTAGEPALPGHPDLNLVSNVGRTTPPRSVFHVDTSYVSRPPAYTALRAVTIPDAGGHTLFSNQYRAARTLPADLRDQVVGRLATHVVTGVDPGDEQEHRARHPLLRPHPLTAEVALYLTTPARCVGVDGLDADAATTLIASLYAHSIREDNVYRHRWRRGDVVMWDNVAVMHRADHDGVVGDRVMHRGMVSAGVGGPGGERGGAR
jgi:taurine dioxygenase